jgi:two-component system LytT family response regulator
MIRVLTVDDERLARAKVARLLAADPRFTLAAEATDGQSAIDLVHQLEPDLLILDLRLPGRDGLEVLDATTSTLVVLSTAHAEHALQAYDAGVVDYLLKPYDAARFQRALDKAATMVAATRPPSNKIVRRDEHLVIRDADGGWQRIPEAELIRISSAGKYVCLVTARATHVVREPLRAVLTRLDPHTFVAVRRGEVVRLSAVERVVSLDHGDARLTLAGGAELTLSRTHRAAFLARYLA